MRDISSATASNAGAGAATSGRSRRRRSSTSTSTRPMRFAGSRARKATAMRGVGFCGECGSSLFWQAADAERVSIAAGTLDPPDRAPRRRAHLHAAGAATGARSAMTASRAIPTGLHSTRSAGPEIGANSAQRPPEALPILARLTDLVSPLRELFGFDAFRPGQEDVVRAAIAGATRSRSCRPARGSRSRYQLAAMLRPEPTLVLSPLIALMKDQVDKLPPQIAATATFVNSSLSPEETAQRLAAVASGETRLVYAAPERLRQARFVELLARVGIGLVVVDEVHCVSMWGHDFRPDYLFIRRGLEALGEPTLLGMTATATPRRHATSGRRSVARSRSSTRACASEPALRRRGGR